MLAKDVIKLAPDKIETIFNRYQQKIAETKAQFADDKPEWQKQQALKALEYEMHLEMVANGWEPDAG